MKLSISLLNRFRSAFTLLELLLAVFLVGVLTLLVVTSFRAMSRSAKGAQCVGNLQQLGGGLLSWASDNNNRLPSRKLADENGAKIYDWMGALEKGNYVGGPKRPENSLFFCPAAPKPEDKAECYGMRQWGSHELTVQIRRDAELPISIIKHPSRFFLLADSAKAVDNGFVQWYAIQQGTANNGAFLVHNNHANAVFADGHVQRVDREYFETHHLLEPEIFRAKDNCTVLSPKQF